MRKKRQNSASCYLLAAGPRHDEAVVDVELHFTPRLPHILQAEKGWEKDKTWARKAEFCLMLPARRCLLDAATTSPLSTLNYISLQGCFIVYKLRKNKTCAKRQNFGSRDWPSQVLGLKPLWALNQFQPLPDVACCLLDPATTSPLWTLDYVSLQGLDQGCFIFYQLRKR